MILRHLKLENIRSYRSAEINFPNGSLLLSGDIGAGKTTILLSIEFALFGIMRGGFSGSTLLRHGEKAGSVELEFKIEDNNYTVKRTLKKSRDSVMQDSGYIIKNGVKFEGTPVELKAKIIDMLGYPKELISKSKSLIYRYTVYTPQEEMKQILFEDKDSRLDTLRKVFGIDKYKTIKENSVVFIRELKRKQSELLIRTEDLVLIEDKKTNLEGELLKLNKEKGVISEKLILLKQKRAIFTQSLETIEADMEKYREVKKNIEIKKSELNTKERQIKDTLERLSEIKQKLQKLNDKQSLYENIIERKPEKEIEDNLLELEKKYSELIKKESSKEKEINMFSSRIRSLNEEIEDYSKKSKDAILLKSELEPISEKIHLKKDLLTRRDELLEKSKQAEIKTEKINHRIEHSKNIMGKVLETDFCPTCMQEVSKEHKHDFTIKEKSNQVTYENEKKRLMEISQKIKEHLSKINLNLNKIEELEKIHKEKSLRLAAYEEASKFLVGKQKELNECLQKRDFLVKQETKEDVETLQKKIEEIKVLLSKNRDNNLKYREKKNITELINSEKENSVLAEKDLDKINLEKESVAKTILLLEKELKEKGDIEELYRNKKEEYEKHREEEKIYEIKFSSINENLQFNQKQLKEADEKINEIKHIKEKAEHISEILNWFDVFFLKLMITMEKHIMISIHKEFNSILKKWFSILIDDIEINLDDQFSPIVTIEGYETSLDSLSGGEKTSVGLAYRLALNKVINDLISTIKTKDIIILDEPTDGFSTEQLDKVRDVLAELNLKQTVIVSHEAKMETYVDNILRVSKNDNVSSI